MILVWSYALISVFIVSIISLAGVITLSWQEARVRRLVMVLVALSAGALLGDAIIHLLPEIFDSYENSLLPSALILAGLFSFFILEKFLAWGHSHQLRECTENSHHEIKPLGQINLISDALHNLIDGLAIGASYLVSREIGLATTLAVILHEIPQEIGDFGILLHAGYSIRKALWFNLLSALTAILGTILAVFFGQHAHSLATFILPLAAGGFLYIAGSDLVPELHKTIGWRQSLIQFGAMLFGIGSMFLLLFLE